MKDLNELCDLSIDAATKDCRLHSSFLLVCYEKVEESRRSEEAVRYYRLAAPGHVHAQNSWCLFHNGEALKAAVDTIDCH